jgi:hypothetical protein
MYMPDNLPMECVPSTAFPAAQAPSEHARNDEWRYSNRPWLRFGTKGAAFTTSCEIGLFGLKTGELTLNLDLLLCREIQRTHCKAKATGSDVSTRRSRDG